MTHAGAQCFPTAAASGGTAVNDASVGTLAFQDAGLSLSSDNDFAHATALVALFDGSSNYLKVTGFNFSIPSYASICGITVEIDKRATGIILGAWIRDNEIRIVKANSVTGTDRADESANWVGTESTFTYGGSTDLWGTTFTPAEVNSSGFGVAISARLLGLVGVFPSARIDHVRIIVHYNPVLPVKLLSFNAGIRKNTTILNWETADEGDNEFITLQRSVTGQSEWTDLARYSLHSDNQRKQYQYSDALVQKGGYSYRLQITNSNQQLSYSAIKQVVYNGSEIAVAYPNPATDFIQLDNLASTRSIRISNINQQLISLPVQITGERSARINIQSLPRGTYFIRTENQTLKFFKD